MVCPSTEPWSRHHEVSLGLTERQKTLKLRHKCGTFIPHTPVPPALCTAAPLHCQSLGPVAFLCVYHAKWMLSLYFTDLQTYRLQKMFFSQSFSKCLHSNPWTHRLEVDLLWLFCLQWTLKTKGNGRKKKWRMLQWNGCIRTALVQSYQNTSQHHRRLLIN